MSLEYSDAELLGYLDEALPVEKMAGIETQLRASEPFRQRLATLRSGRDSQGHTVGDIWRRGRLSCPDRRQLGSFLLGALPPDHAEYIEFHLQTVGCRFCQSNLADLREASRGSDAAVQRRQKFFQSSAGYVRPLEAQE
ncbi:MAG: hypothetical protein ACKV0T_12365 [Planctomycetales bacterium]